MWMPRSCIAVPGSAFSRAEHCRALAEQIHTGATGRSGVRARASLARAIKVVHAGGQPASARSGAAPDLAQRQLGERVPAPAERRIWRPCVHRARPSGTSAAGGLDYHGARMALHPAAPTPPPSADRLMHSTRAQDAMEPRIDDFATKSRAGGFVGHVRNTPTISATNRASGTCPFWACSSDQFCQDFKQKTRLHRTQYAVLPGATT